MLDDNFYRVQKYNKSGKERNICIIFAQSLLMTTIKKRI